MALRLCVPFKKIATQGRERRNFETICFACRAPVCGRILKQKDSEKYILVTSAGTNDGRKNLLWENFVNFLRFLYVFWILSFPSSFIINLSACFMQSNAKLSHLHLTVVLCKCRCSKNNINLVHERSCFKGRRFRVIFSSSWLFRQLYLQQFQKKQSMLVICVFFHPPPSMHSIAQPVWREVLEGSDVIKGHAVCENIFAITFRLMNLKCFDRK